MKLYLSALFILVALMPQTGRADVQLSAGQSVVVSCGGGGGNSSQCVSDLTDYCNSKTSMNSTDCFNTINYCPSTSYRDCVEQTTDYCNAHTSMNYTDCFRKSLGSCRGNVNDIRSLMDKAIQSGRMLEKGLDPQSAK